MPFPVVYLNRGRYDTKFSGRFLWKDNFINKFVFVKKYIEQYSDGDEAANRHTPMMLPTEASTELPES